MHRSEQRETTRRALIDVAARRFAVGGFAATALSEIVAEAAVTKGALYHHFSGKAALFEAVLAEAQASVSARVVHAAESAEADGWGRLLAGCRAFLDSSTDASVRRVMLIDGPAVLGWSRWRAYDDAASARHLGEAITSLVEDGTLLGDPVATTRLLSGAMNEAALWLAESSRDVRSADLDVVMTSLTRMLEGLRERPDHRTR